MKRDPYMGDPIVLTVYCAHCTSEGAAQRKRIGYVTRWGTFWWHLESGTRERELVEATALNDPPDDRRTHLMAWCPVHGSGRLGADDVAAALTASLTGGPRSVVLSFVA